MLMRILSVILIMATASTSIAQTCDLDTKESLRLCDAAYNAQKQLIKDQGDQINNFFKKDQLQNRIIDDQKEKLDSPFRDPVKMIGLGIVGTVVVEVLLGAFRR